MNECLLDMRINNKNLFELKVDLNEKKTLSFNFELNRSSLAWYSVHGMKAV